MFSEDLEKILEQVLMKHHDDISSQDDDAMAEARDAISELVKGIVPEEKKHHHTQPILACYECHNDEVFNSCRTEMLRRVE